jgi:hypothetical protein
MWARLGSEFLNLDHIIRVRFNKSWTKDGECLVAEVEATVNGQVKQFIRYRGADAEVLQGLLAGVALETTVVTVLETVPAHAGMGSAAIPTLSDL